MSFNKFQPGCCCAGDCTNCADGRPPKCADGRYPTCVSGTWVCADASTPTCGSGTFLCDGCCSSGHGAADIATLSWPGGVTSAGGCPTCDELPAGTYDLGPETNITNGCQWVYGSGGADCNVDCNTGGATADLLTGCNRSCTPFGDNSATGCFGSFISSLVNNHDGTCSVEMQACIEVCEGSNSTGGETGYCAAAATYKSAPFATGSSCPGTRTLTKQPGDYVNDGFAFHGFCAGAWPATCTLTI
jgi:hypothetical protein